MSDNWDTCLMPAGAEMRKVVVLDNLEVLDAAPKLAVIRITNPLNPREFVHEELSWEPSRTLAGYFPTGMAESVISVNGRIIPTDQYGMTYLDRTDNLVICPVPVGGGDGKSILRIVAMIAVVYFTAGMGEGAAWAMGVGDGFTATALGSALQVGVTMAGSMLVNALLPPSQSTANSQTSKTTSSYGIDGAKNTSVEGISVPVLYGEFRTGGNIVNMFVENDGDAQVLYMRMVISEGPINSITDIELNDQPMASFSTIGGNGSVGSIDIDCRLGSSDQSVMDWFADSIVPQSINTRLTTGWTSYTTGSIDKYRIDFSAPAGLSGVNAGDGSTYAVTVPLEIQQRVAGSGGAWLTMPAASDLLGSRQAVGVSYDGGSTFTWTWHEANSFGSGAPYASQGNGVTITDAWALNYLASNHSAQLQWVGGDDWGYNYTGSVPIYSQAFQISDNKRSAVRKSVMSAQLARAAYEIRVRRTTLDSTDATVSDAVYVTDINEIKLEQMALPNTALLSLRIRLFEQLTGLPKITCRALGVLIMVNRLPRPNFTLYGVADPAGRTWYYEYSNNPAWIVWDILTNTRYGGGIDSSRLDLVAFQAFADHCIAQGLTWNGPIDSQMNVWDACQLVSRVGHAQLIGVGTRFTVVIENAATPVMMFSVANMIEGTFKESWVPVTDRANEIEVTYFDQLDSYKQRTVKVYDPAALAAGRPPRNSAITLYGVVDHDIAFKEGLFQLNLNRYILQTVEFGAPMEAIACTVGDLIYVQHDMPQWGFAGRFNAGCTASAVNLDREVTLTAGVQYKLLVVHDALQRATGSVSSVAGTSVFLTGFNGLLPVKRLKFGTLDKQVAGIFSQGSGAYGVVLTDVTGITAGGTYSLWDTDVLEERDVVNSAATVTALTLQSPLTQAPAQFMHWMFGEVGKYKKPFRVKAISGSHEYRRDITAIEYNDSVYNLSGTPVPTPNYSSLTSAVQQVVIDGADEDLFAVGSIFRSHVTVHFHSPQESYARASVYATVNGGASQLLDANAFDRATIDCDDSDVVVFKVVPRDVLGISAPSAAATTLQYTVIGKLAPPKNIASATYAIEQFGIHLYWSAVPDLDLDYYEIRVDGANWGTATFLTTTQDLETLWKIQTAGTRTVRIAARDTSGNYSLVPFALSVAVAAPGAPASASYSIIGSEMVLTWAIPLSGFGVDRFEIRYGATWEGGTSVTTTKATTYRSKVDWLGGRTWWINAIDTAGNAGSPASLAVTINAPGLVTGTRSEVVDNNALLYWAAPAIGAGQLPIDRYEVRKGSTWAAGTVIGSNGNSTFTVVFEQASGTYTYWVASVDTAGNYGTAVGITATVNQPPDYLLRNDYNSPLTGTPLANVTRTVTNFYAEGSSYYGPVDTTQSWATHFSSNGWTSPSAQVAAGYPVYADPSVVSGVYEEVIDYGTAIPPTIVTATLSTAAVTGTVTPTCTLSWKLALGDAWTVLAVGTTTALLPSFRYVKVHYDFASTAGANLIQITALNVKLAIKTRNDSGMGTAAVGGTVVTFGYPFVEADTPVVQPGGSVPRIPVVNYSNVPNPTSFTVQIYSLAGVDVGGPFSWTAKGY